MTTGSQTLVPITGLPYVYCQDDKVSLFLLSFQNLFLARKKKRTNSEKSLGRLRVDSNLANVARTRWWQW